MIVFLQFLSQNLHFDIRLKARPHFSVAQLKVRARLGQCLGTMHINISSQGLADLTRRRARRESIQGELLSVLICSLAPLAGRGGFPKEPEYNGG
jgi:hypothetical protein